MAFSHPSRSSEDNAYSPRSYHSSFVAPGAVDDAELSPTSAPASVFHSRSVAGDVSPLSQAASAFPSPLPSGQSHSHSHSRGHSQPRGRSRSRPRSAHADEDVSPRSTATRPEFSPPPEARDSFAEDVSPTSQPGSTFARPLSVPPHSQPVSAADDASAVASAIRSWSISTSEYSEGDPGAHRTDRTESDASLAYHAQAAAAFSQPTIVPLPLSTHPSLSTLRESAAPHAPAPTMSHYHEQDPRSNSVSSSLYDSEGAANPFEGGHNPFDTPMGEPTGAAGGPLGAPAAPRIQLEGDSIPGSPDAEGQHGGDIATFGASSFGSGSPAHTRPVSPARSPSDTTPFETPYDTPLHEHETAATATTSALPARASAGAGSVSTTATSAAAQRRAQRVKTAASSIRSGRSRQAGAARPAGTQNPDAKRKPFQSTRLKGEIYKPWLEKKDPAMRWARWITIISIIIGLGAAGAICYDGYASVPSLGKTCLVLNDDFSTLDTSVWTREVRLDGYGNGEFEWTTASDNNSFVEDGILYLVPTLTADVLGADAITNGYTLNLTADGTCTSTNVSQCAAVSNSSLLTVINPVQSARLTTQHSLSVKYGRVEVRARFPTGDWLWPSITMLPVNETYGAWPRSGQIDIVTGRGNNASYATRGVDYAQSDIHWGPTVDLDREYLTWGYREERRKYYNQEWHTFGLEWNENYMWTYTDTKVSQSMSLRFNKESFWKRGDFPDTITNNSVVEKLTNPWVLSENNVAPFDQSFYLIIDLAVGGTSGWFPDGEGGKPWLDDSVSAMSDFWAAKDKWYDTWPEDKTQLGFAIDSVKVWKTC
ncbi:hypothetical protein Q5752_002308 [Cryptotrichosporon argae]